MKDVTITQNWMSIVGFKGKKKNGYTCEDGKDFAITDYVELRIDADKDSPLYKLYLYTKEDWKKAYPDAEPFVEKDGKTHGDLISKQCFYTMEECVDRIIAYVHFNHDNHAFNTMFFEIGNVENRDSINLDTILSDAEKQEIISFAKAALKKDFLKEDKYAEWNYSENAKGLGIETVKEDTKRVW